MIDAILRRGGHRCAWCGCKLRMKATTCPDEEIPVPTILKLDATENDSAMVASCAECAREYAKWWPAGHAYSFENAKRFLGRCLRTGSGPFVDYLEARAKASGRGIFTPFNTALARIEAQRNAPLDLRRKVA